MKEKRKLIYIMLVIIILILVFLNIRLFINNNFEKISSKTQNEITNRVYNTTSDEEDEQNRKNKIASLDTRNRMQTYFGTYISYIESKDYENAYSLLYDGFKQTYFPTLQDFENYAKQAYPSNIVVDYVDISGEGTMYILELKIRDSLNSNKQTETDSIQAVILEEDVNDYKISFEIK